MCIWGGGFCSIYLKARGPGARRQQCLVAGGGGTEVSGSVSSEVGFQRVDVQNGTKLHEPRLARWL